MPDKPDMLNYNRSLHFCQTLCLEFAKLYCQYLVLLELKLMPNGPTSDRFNFINAPDWFSALLVCQENSWFTEQKVEPRGISSNICYDVRG